MPGPPALLESAAGCDASRASGVARREAPLGALAGAFRGTPAVVVGSGPSLDLQMADLAAARDRVLLVSMSSAARPLLAAGLTPDLVVAGRSSSGLLRLTHAAPDQTFLAAALDAPSSTLARFVSRTFFFQQEMDGTALDLAAAAGLSLPDSSSSLLAAVAVARLAGSPRILLAGIDMALTGGRAGCRASASDDEDLVLAAAGVSALVQRRARLESPGTLAATDIYGWPTVTTKSLLAQRDALLALAASSTVTLVNTTPGGILFGSSIVTAALARALEGAQPTSPPPSVMLRAIHRRAGAASGGPPPVAPTPAPTTAKSDIDEPNRIVAQALSSHAAGDRTIADQTSDALSEGDLARLAGEALRLKNGRVWLARSVPPLVAEIVCIANSSAQRADTDTSAEPTDPVSLAVVTASDLALDAGTLRLSEFLDRLVPGGTLAIIDIERRRLGGLVRRAVYDLMRNRGDLTFVQPRSDDWTSRLDLLRVASPAGKAYVLDEIYERSFYDKAIAWNADPSRRLARMVVDRYRPSSVIDLGCGTGAWLKAFHDLGVTDLRGVEGSREAMHVLPPDVAHVVAHHDLRTPFRPDRRYDLCLCLDVIEHVEPEFAEHLVSAAVASSDCILFSSPAPGQGGDGHVNERPLAYWADQFLAHGYLLFDELRPSLEAESPLARTTYDLNLLVARRVCPAGQVSSWLDAAPGLRDFVLLQAARLEDLHLHGLWLNVAHHQRITEAWVGMLAPDLSWTDLPLSPGQMAHDDGMAFDWRFRTATAGAFTRSPIWAQAVVCEDGVPLSSPRAHHTEIRRLGSGRYSAWLNRLIFSTPDGSDPRENGRVYTVRVPAFLAMLERLPPDVVTRARL